MTAVPPIQPTATNAPVPGSPKTALQRLRAFGRPPRVVALDIARGLAVLGMAAAHTVSLPGEIRLNDPSTWVEIVSGRSSILFAVLAGISIAIMTGRTRIPADTEIGRLRLQLVARGLVIFAIGLALELLGTSIAVILTFYGAVYAVAILFIGVRVCNLLIWATALAIAGPALTGVLLALSASGSGVTFILGGTYSIVPWTVLMLVGLALGRLDVTRRKTAAFALLIGVALSAVGYTAGGLWEAAQYGDGGSWSASSSEQSSLLEDEYEAEVIPGKQADLTGKLCEDYGDGYLSCYPEDEYVDTTDDASLSDEGNGWASYPDMIANADVGATMLSAFLSSSPHSGGTMEILGSGGLALALIGLLLLTGQSLRYVLLPIAAVGAMPLTAYTAHVIVIWTVIGPGGWNQPPLLYPFLAGGLLVACTAWTLLIGRGPLERLTAWCSTRLAPGPGGPERRGHGTQPERGGAE